MDKRFGKGFPDDKLPEKLEFRLDDYFGEHAEEGFGYEAGEDIDHISAEAVLHVSSEVKVIFGTL